MTERYSTLRQKIIEIQRKLLEKNLVVGPAGNISCRTPEENTFLITPSSIPRNEITPSDILLIDGDGKVLDGSLNPSREYQMHLAIYDKEEDAGAVIHSHPPYSTVLSIVGRIIPPLTDEFVVFVGKSVNISDYAVSGSSALAKNVAEKIGDNRAILLANHGLLCYGKDLEDALFISQLVEETAKIYVHALAIGEPKALPDDVVEAQFKIFKKLKSRE
ncbi:MAG: class II aldolase/adducin family protein [Candidatus Odinarchaeia archaeon]